MNAVETSKKENHGMVSSFIMINCELGEQNNIMNSMKEFTGVIEIHGTYGAYDLIAKLNTNSDSAMRELVSKIRKIETIRSTMTLMEAASI